MTARPLFALAAALATSLFAAAPTAAETRSISVSYADLNLASAAGRTTLENRIARAATRVCRYNGSPDLKSQQLALGCRTTAMADALAKVELAAANSSSPQYAAAGSAGGR